MESALKVRLFGLMKIVLTLTITFLGYSQSNGHDIYTSELTVIQYDSVLHLELRMNAFELESLGGKEMIKNGVIDWDRFSDSKEKIITKLNKALVLKLDNNPLFTDKTGITIDDTHHLIFRSHYNLTDDQRNGSLRIESKLREFTSRSHVTKVSFKRSGQQENAQLEGDRNSVEFELVQKNNDKVNKITNSKSTSKD